MAFNRVGLCASFKGGNGKALPLFSVSSLLSSVLFFFIHYLSCFSFVHVLLLIKNELKTTPPLCEVVFFLTTNQKTYFCVRLVGRCSVADFHHTVRC